MNTSQPNGGIQMVYADYQATTPVDPRVLEKMTPYWRELFGNPIRAIMSLAGVQRTPSRRRRLWLAR